MAAPPHAAYPSDSVVEFTDISDILFADYGFQVLHGALDGGLEMPQEHVRALEEEVAKRECSLMHVPGYGLERVVFVLALKIIDENDYILMQLGVFTETKALRPDAKLPAVKRMANEAPHEALDRLLKTKLAVLEPLLLWGDREHNTQIEESATYGIRTRYIRTVQLATWTSGLGHQPSDLVTVPRRSSTVRTSFRHPRHSRASMRSLRSIATATTEEVDCKNSFLLKTHDGGVRLYAWVSPSLHSGLMHSWRRKEILKGLIDGLDKSSLPAAEILFDTALSEAACHQASKASSMGLSSRGSGNSSSSQQVVFQQEESLIGQQMAIKGLDHGTTFKWLHL